MKQLSSLLVPLCGTLVCLFLIGLFQPALALRKNTAQSSLYGALSGDNDASKPLYQRVNLKTLIDAPTSLEQESINQDQPNNPFEDISKEAQQVAEKNLTNINSLLEKQAEPITRPQEKEVVSQPVSVAKQKAPVVQSQLRPHLRDVADQAAPTPKARATTLMPKNNDENELIEFQFEGTDLENLVKQVSILYDVIFIPDDSISPLPQNSKSLKGNKVSFKTHKTLTKGQAWDLFVTFLTLSGFTLFPEGHANTYRITVLKTAQHEALPTYINIDYKNIPDTDELIRYVYFIENATTETIEGITKSFASPDALVYILKDSKALVITDRAYNIKVLMNVIKELDKASMPQELMVIKLRQVDAQHVKELYESLVQSQDASGYQRFFPPRKTPTSLYFPENVRLIAEKRTNTLIALGPKDALKVLEEFIVKHIDVALDQPYSKLTTHQLKYADAETIAKIMNDVTKIGASTPAGQVGGVRGSDKFFKPITFVAEPSTNKLIIRGDYEDYLLVKPAIEALDVQQPQVAIEVLLLAVESGKLKQLGAQLRTKQPSFGLLGNNVKFQTSGLDSNVVENTTETTGANRLLGDLISLVAGSSFGNAGKTVLTLGSDKYGVWGIFRALEQITDSQIISNPFITTSNKTPARVSVGETRRILASIIYSGSDPVTKTPTYKDDSADLSVNITPQINSDGMISLQIDIDISQFTSAASSELATKVTRKIVTNAIVANKEILALGGLLQNKSNDTSVKVPVLGDLPLIGWLFKDKRKDESQNTLLVLISTQIISPTSQDPLARLRQNRSEDITQTLKEIDNQISTRTDPIDKTFFSGRMQDPKDRFFTEYIDRKFGVKEYQELAKKAKKRSPKKEKKPKEHTSKKSHAETEPAHIVTQEEAA